MAIAAETITDWERKRLNDAWAVAGRAGIHQTRSDLLDAVDSYAAAVGAEHTARETVRACDDIYAAAVASAEWLLDSRFVTEGNKTYLVTDDDEFVNHELEDGTVTRRPTGQKIRKAMTADERAAWRKREAGRDPEVVEASRRLAAAEAELARIRADIAVATTRVSALKHALDASIALLNALTASITTEGTIR